MRAWNGGARLAAAAADLDEDGAARLLLDLGVDGAVLDAQHVEHAEDVVDHLPEVRLALPARNQGTPTHSAAAASSESGGARSSGLWRRLTSIGSSCIPK